MRAFFWMAMLALAATTATHGEEIVLVSGERLSGEIVDRGADRVILAHPLLGRLEIDTAVIQEVEGESAASIDVEPEAEAPPSPPADTDATPPAPAPADVNHQVELGYNARIATVDTQQARFAYRLERRDEDNVFKADVGYRYASTDDRTTQSALTAGLDSTWPLRTDALGAFVQARYDFADFQSWDQRVTANAGLSYTLFDVKRTNPEGGITGDLFKLTARGGGGMRKEFGSLDEELEPEALVGGELAWSISPTQSLTAGSTFFPNTNDSDDYRVVSHVNWTVAINSLDGISLRLGLNHEYQSMVDPGIAHDDLSLFATLVFDF